ncbi:hypothetical protein [Spongiibacter tropicus]|uniref:hypothetical protein n=1 Tax=Spongiibacter tropicus TaxID=454602 RepID=UPI00235607CF|nr:hypothetical protein [Spongiibacter tropicus]
MSRVYRIRLMFEWGGGSLWCGNQAAARKFDVGPVEDKLPLSNTVLERLNALSQWHDTALNWEYPPDPGPWGPDEYAKFEAEALAFLSELQTELGPDFEVAYEPN